MAGVISDLKTQARILHRQIEHGESHAVVRTRRLPELRNRDASELPALVKRRHCLAIVARELGFEGWPHAVGVLSGTDSTDFGTLLYPDGADAHWNIWSASYGEARSIREPTPHLHFLLRV